MANLKPTLVLVSPLWRTLQTCTTALRERHASDGFQCKRVIATDEIREHNNQNPCNHRRAISSDHSAAFGEAFGWEVSARVVPLIRSAASHCTSSLFCRILVSAADQIQGTKKFDHWYECIEAGRPYTSRW